MANTYLTTTFQERLEAKALRARWDAAKEAGRKFALPPEPDRLKNYLSIALFNERTELCNERTRLCAEQGDQLAKVQREARMLQMDNELLTLEVRAQKLQIAALIHSRDQRHADSENEKT